MNYEIQITTVIIATFLETMTICTILVIVATIMKDNKPTFLVPWLSVGALMAIVGIGLFFWKEIQVTNNDDFLHFIGQPISDALNGDAGPAVAVVTVLSLLIVFGTLKFRR